MKTQIKDIVIGIFAVIGFTAVVMGFTNQTEPQQTYGTPESHVWEMYGAEGNGAFIMNKVTGELKVIRANSSGSKAYLLQIEKK